jgi:negative regulator of replication initiation
MEKIIKSKNERIPENDTDISFETLNYRNQEIKKKAKSTTDKNKYKSYIKKYKDIVKKIINMISEIKSFIESEKQLDKKDIYNFTS